jgi:hypothetical protein
VANDPGAAGPGAPSEEELRAAYEAELSRITTTDMIAQATVSLLNLGARRLGPPPQPVAGAAEAQEAAEQNTAAAAGRDLGQARDAIDAARALLAILERTIPAKELAPLRDALSQLQMAYAREIQTNPAEVPPPAATAAPAQGKPAESAAKPSGQTPKDAPGPAQASGRLWVPGS